MKIPVDRKRTLITFAIADLIFAVFLFVSCINLFIFQKWGVVQILIIAIYVVFSVVMLVLSLTRNFYVIEGKYLVTVKGFKEMYYYYTDVVYIDKAQSEKRRVLCFYTNKGHTRYLPFDKEGKIYAAMCNKCHNLLNDEEFKTRFPNVKI
ncbi:MAG: hypothetical protein J6X50_00450 [Bacilli bacterium]|nr:hypothetical protein [Bacilli bacterium]